MQGWESWSWFYVCTKAPVRLRPTRHLASPFIPWHACACLCASTWHACAFGCFMLQWVELQPAGSHSVVSVPTQLQALVFFVHNGVPCHHMCVFCAHNPCSVWLMRVGCCGVLLTRLLLPLELAHYVQALTSVLYQPYFPKIICNTHFHMPCVMPWVVIRLVGCSTGSGPWWLWHYSGQQLHQNT